MSLVNYNNVAQSASDYLTMFNNARPMLRGTANALRSYSNYKNKSNRAVQRKKSLPAYAKNFSPRMSKRVKDDRGWGTKDNNIVYVNTPVPNISQGTNINQRDRQQIWLEGMKVNLHVVNKRTASAAVVRWACLSYKGLQNTLATADIKTDMFYGNLSLRYVDFDDISDPMHKAQYSINRDKYIVHAEGTFELGGKPAGSAGQAVSDTKNFHTLTRYIPIKRKITYDGSTGADFENMTFFCYWVNTYDTDIAVADVNSHDGRFHSIAFFRDI